jgi:allophanate hydrolase
MAGIPAPLGIGTLRLEGGGAAKGFLCEAAGIDGARDISALADWRLFLAETAARKAS